MDSRSKIFGEVLVDYMKTNNMKSWQFAKKVGISAASLSRYINGVVYPSFETIIKISETTGISTEELLGTVKKNKSV